MDEGKIKPREIAKIIKIADGLSIKRVNDGDWLTVEGGTETAVFRLQAMRALEGSAFRAWAEEQFKKAEIAEKAEMDFYGVLRAVHGTKRLVSFNGGLFGQILFSITNNGGFLIALRSGTFYPTPQQMREKAWSVEPEENNEK